MLEIAEERPKCNSPCYECKNFRNFETKKCVGCGAFYKAGIVNSRIVNYFDNQNRPVAATKPRGVHAWKNQANDYDAIAARLGFKNKKHMFDELYINRMMSHNRIAREIGVCNASVRNYLKNNGYQMRTREDYRKGNAA